MTVKNPPVSQNTIVLPAGTESVKCSDIPRLIAAAKFPYESKKRRAFEKIVRAQMLMDMASGKLPYFLCH